MCISNNYNKLGDLLVRSFITDGAQRMKHGAWSGVRTFLYVGVPLVLWLIPCFLGVLPDHVLQIGCLTLAPIVFLIGVPMSIILPMDKFGGGLEITLATATAVACLNFILIGALKRLLRP